VKVIIVGSGTAGLFFALMLKNKIPSCEITIIKDPNISVIGVGESTVGTFTDFMKNHLGVNIDEFYEYVNPVTKKGVYFKFGKKDFHFTFDTVFDYEYSDDQLPIGFRFKGGNYGNSNQSLDMISKTGIFDYSTGALNIDNSLFIKYLTKIANERGINIINDTIKNIQRQGNNIKSLNDNYKADYYIDCSGFNSVLSNEKFYSYENMLLNDKALFFNTKIKSIRPYTQATTMNSGWLWSIDHSNKISSNGYVFCSKYISDYEALKELESKMKIKITDYRIIPFKSGRLEKHWVGNCITLGNADGFIEPLESSSLMIIMQLSLLITSIIRYDDKKGDLINRYNKFTNSYYDSLRDFIFIHFCFNNKKNTKYWNDYNLIQSKLNDNCFGHEILMYYLNNDTHIKLLSHVYKDENPFGLEGWYSILRGLIPTENDRKLIKNKIEKFN
jgi:tryptophan halogenase